MSFALFRVTGSWSDAVALGLSVAVGLSPQVRHILKAIMDLSKAYLRVRGRDREAKDYSGSTVYAKNLWQESHIEDFACRQMMPMIITANLSRGANKMRKEQTIIRRLDAVQNMGAM